MKDCKKIHPLLPLYLDGLLSPRETGRVETHLKTCADARKEMEDFRRLRQASLALPEPKLPPGLHDKIMARLQGRPLPAPVHHSFWLIPAGVLAAAMATFFLVNQNPTWKEVAQAPVPQSYDKGLVTNRPVSIGPKKTAENEKRQAAKDNLKKEAPAAPANPALDNGFAASQPAVPGVEKPFEEKREKKKMAKARSNTEPSTRSNLGPTAAAPQPEAAMGNVETQGASAPPSNQVADYNLAAKKVEQPAAGEALGLPPAPSPTPVEGNMEDLMFSKEIPAMSWRGFNNLATVESQELVTDADVFKTHWQSLYPGQAPPTLDFTTQAVVFLAAGEKPTAGYSIHVSALQEKADQLVIHYKVEAPAPGAVEAQVLTYPWSMQVIPKPVKQVVFQKD